MKMVKVWMMVLLCATTAQASIKLGVIGDSLSDEYSEETYSYAKNWLEQLAEAGKVDAGPFSTTTIGEPRRKGYEYNWALYGATLYSAVASGQHTELKKQVVGTEGVDHVVFAVGANDFAPKRFNYEYIYYAATYGGPNAISDGIAAEISLAREVLDTFKGTPAKLVMATIPDYGVAPGTYGYYTDGAKRELVATVIREVNSRILALGQEYKVPVVDLYTATKAIVGENTDSMDPGISIKFGGVDLYPHQSDTLTQPHNPTAGFVHDQLHPNTTVQGAMANMFLTAFNLGYGENNTLFTESEILANAGITGGGGNTLFNTTSGQLGAKGYTGYSSFVILPVPEPSTLVLLVTGLLGLLAYAWRKRKS